MNLRTTGVCLCLALGVFNGCASTPALGNNSTSGANPTGPAKGTPEPAKPDKPREPEKPLQDQSAETDYALSDFASRFEMADDYARSGKRAAGAVVLSGIKLKLAENAKRERLFVDLKIAEVWGGDGDARESDKAREMIRQVQRSAPDDARLLADASLALCVVALADGDLHGAHAHAHEALTHYEKAQAHRRFVEACRFSLRRFLAHNDAKVASDFAARGYARVCEIEAPSTRCLMALDCALLSFKAGADQAAGPYLEDAFAAGRKANDRWLCNSVVAAAVREFWAKGNAVAVVTWGDRLRDDTYGLLPTQAASTLDGVTYAQTLAWYALAQFKESPGAKRTEQSLKAAKDGLDQALEQASSLEAGDEALLKDLSEKVENALLKIAGG